MALLYELAVIDGIVDKTLCPDNFKKLTAAKCKKLIEQLGLEEEKIKEIWKVHVFALTDIRAAELYVQNRQSAVIFLANQLDKHKDEVASGRPRAKKTGAALAMTTRNGVTALYNQAEQTLRRLLEFIETYFNRFYDTKANVPNSYFVMAQKGLQEKLGQFQKKIKAGSSDKLINVFIRCFEKQITTRQTAKLSFRDIVYLKEMMNEMLHSPVDSEAVLFEKLVYMNFNSAEVISHCTTKYKLELEELASDDDKVKLLCEWHRKIQYIIQRPDAGLNVEWPSLQQWMLGWMEEQREALEVEPAVTKAAIAEEKDDQSAIRLKTPLSVAQIGLFFWLLFETGLLVCGYGKKSSVVRKVIAAFSSKNVDHIAFESLRTKMYRRYNSDIRAVKDAIIVLLNKVNEVGRGEL